MPSNHYKNHLKNGHRIYHRQAFRYNAELPTREFVSWNISKLLWTCFVIGIALTLIFLSGR